MIAAYSKKYLENSAKFIDGETVINAPVSNVCDKCHRDFSELPVKSRFMSEDKKLNKELNRPGRLCVACYYRPYYESGHAIPAPIASLF